MFKTLYRCARAAARHESGPATQSRLADPEHLAAEVDLELFAEKSA
jgi:hypothetical protein